MHAQLQQLCTIHGTTIEQIIAEAFITTGGFQQHTLFFRATPWLQSRMEIAHWLYPLEIDVIAILLIYLQEQLIN
jgi:hypothetical protein